VVGQRGGFEQHQGEEDQAEGQSGGEFLAAGNEEGEGGRDDERQGEGRGQGAELAGPPGGGPERAQNQIVEEDETRRGEGEGVGGALEGGCRLHNSSLQQKRRLIYRWILLKHEALVGFYIHAISQRRYITNGASKELID
jgi:hypothetical protein